MARVGSRDSPALGTQLAEGDGLLGWQIANDEAIDAGVLAVVQQGLLAVCAQRVVVAHEQNRRLQPSLAGIANHLEGAREGDAILKCDLVTVSEGQAEDGGGVDSLTVLDVWMVGPSAIGSVKGIPSSIMSCESEHCVSKHPMAVATEGDSLAYQHLLSP